MDIFNTYTLIDEQTGNLALRVQPFEGSHRFEELQRLNHYSLIWVKNGRGKAQVDFLEYEVSANNLLALTPYQPFTISEVDLLQGVVLNFHPDFFCIHKHHQQIACNGVLFNDVYSPPLVFIDKPTAIEFELLVYQMMIEIQKSGLAQYELLLSYLKIFLITASRLKSMQHPSTKDELDESKEPYILQNLKSLIEAHFRTKHSASDYADLLNITPKALAKITKSHFNKTITNLISERIIIEAKRELYLTDKTVKEIAYDLGYEDEYYFSRFFKNNVDISPKFYRDTVGFARGSA